MSDPTVFVIEDDAPIRDSLRIYLELMNYNVRTFSSADEILAVYNHDWTGCLVVDVRLPGMTGLDLVDELHRRGCRLPVMVMTGHTDGNSLRLSTEANVVAILEKPIPPEKLKEIIENVI